MPAALAQTLAEFVRSVKENLHVTALRVHIDIQEDPDHPMTLWVREILLNGSAAPPTLPPLPAPTPPAPGTTANTAPAVNGQERDERAPPLHDCVRDILNTLREVKRPLTKTRLFEEMTKKNRIWGETTIMKYLKNLIEDGTVQNPEDARPRGYRLADEGES